MGPVGFATRNLKRRGFHAFLAFAGLTLTTAATTSQLLLGQSLALRLGVDSYARMTYGIAWLFLGYLFLALGLVILVGILSTSYLVSSMISQRTKDIAVVKAAGCVPRLLFYYSLTEAMIVILSSCTAGALAALAIYGSWSGSPFAEFNQVTLLIVLGVPAACFLASYLAARSQLRKIILTSSMDAISSQLSSLDLRTVGRPVRIQALGSAFNLAAKTVSRDRLTGRTIVRVGVCIFLASVILMGALVSWDTSRSYVERAMPRHVVIIGSNTMVSQYEQLGRSFSTIEPIQPVDYVNASNLITPGMAQAFRGIAGVEEVDTRLIIMTSVTGYVKAHIESDQNTGERLVPETFTGTAVALIVGVDLDNAVGNWATSDGFLRSTDPWNTIVAGDSLMGSIVRTPLDLAQVGVFGVRFNVRSSLVDPLNNGLVLYAPLGSLQSTLGIAGYNLLLVKTDTYPLTLARIAALANGNGLVTGSQDSVLNSNLAFLDRTWSYLFLLPMLTIALTSGILLSYLATNFSRRFNDYVVLKVLGADSWYMFKLLFWEGWGLLVICTAIALPLAFTFSVLFLVPEPQLVATTLIATGTASVSALTAVCIISAVVYSRKLRLTTIKELRV